MSKDAKAAAAKTAVVTPKGIASYAFVWKPQPGMNPGQEAKYSITLLIDKTADLTAMKAAVLAAGQKKFGDKFRELAKLPKFSMPFRDGDVEREDDELYKGRIFVAARSAQQPRIVDHKLRPITDETEFYSGCICRISVNAFGFDVNGNKGVSFGLNNIQKLGDGTRISGRRSAEEDFEPVEAEGGGETTAGGDDLFGDL